jgi:uncharacterized protein DUF642
MRGQGVQTMRVKLLLVGLAVGLVAILAAGTALSAGPNLIVNGSFESPNIPSGSFGIFPSIPGWSFSPRPGTTSSGIEIQDHVAGAPAAGAGDQFMETDSDGPTLVFQDVTTTPGLTYRLDFIYSARPGTPAVQNHFQVSAGPASATIGPITSGAQTNWLPYSLSFVAASSTSRVSFLDLSPEEPAGGFGSFIDKVTLVSNNPPDCSAVTASPAELWPPNHKLKLITLSGGTDPDGDAVTITITGVHQDEPVSGTGAGDTAPDAAAVSASNQLQVRAERSGNGDGRVYVISYTATDSDGNTCSGTETVAVPHSQNGTPAVNSGATYNSFGT